MTIKIPDDYAETGDSHNEPAVSRTRSYQARINSISLPSHPFSPFQVDQSYFRPTRPKASHWSIAWSDVMMTMFILFLSLFIYQAANTEYLVSDKKEIIGGDTRQAVQPEQDNGANFPFMVIKPAAPLVTSGTVKKIEAIALQDIDLDATFTAEEIAATFRILSKEDQPGAAPSTTPDEVSKKWSPPENMDAAIFQPLPLADKHPEEIEISMNDLFLQGMRTLDNYDLNRFASLNLVADKAVRIVLTGDRLFETGQATLSTEAMASLEKIAEVIHNTGYQVHIEGHTDDVPVLSGHFADNWELSLAQANAVAVFLINNMRMNPNQFIVSGYSSYRPLSPNTTSPNRATNRRVEIVITKQTS